MARFWKFNSFVGTVGVILAVVSYFNTHHTEKLTNGVYDITVAAGQSSERVALTLAVVGAVCLGWQILMTLLGLLVGFFRAPNVR